MPRWQTSAGIALGMAAAFVVLALPAGREQNAPSGAPLSDCDGHLRELLIHYEPSAPAIVIAVPREVARPLDRDIVAHVICPTRQRLRGFKV